MSKLKDALLSIKVRNMKLRDEDFKSSAWFHVERKYLEIVISCRYAEPYIWSLNLKQVDSLISMLQKKREDLEKNIASLPAEEDEE